MKWILLGALLLSGCLISEDKPEPHMMEGEFAFLEFNVYGTVKFQNGKYELTHFIRDSSLQTWDSSSILASQSGIYEILDTLPEKNFGLIKGITQKVYNPNDLEIPEWGTFFIEYSKEIWENNQNMRKIPMIYIQNGDTVLWPKGLSEVRLIPYPTKFPIDANEVRNLPWAID